MIAGYTSYSGYGNTPPGGLGVFNTIFSGSKNLNYEKSFSGIDALLLWGGEDISTMLYNEKPLYTYGNYEPSDRDLLEWECLRRAHQRGVPIIGVCRGAQITCAYAGGKLIQDVSHHNFNHDIVTYTGKIFQGVTSSHHQMLYPYRVNHEILATTVINKSQTYLGLSDEEKKIFEDECEPEVVMFPDIKAFCIQGHPEWQYQGDQKEMNSWLYEEIKTRLFGAKK